MHEYNKKLYTHLVFKQYLEARGKTKEPFDKEERVLDILDCMFLEADNEKNYIKYASNYGIYLKDKNAIELNKGALDSLVEEEQRISPFSGNTELVIYQGIPMIKSGINIVEGQVADIYHTHNPYSIEYLQGLSELHNCGFKICFGIFGRTYDKDKSKKFKLVRDYLSTMSGDLEMQYDTERDNYYLIVYNKFKQNVKILRRGR